MTARGIATSRTDGPVERRLVVAMNGRRVGHWRVERGRHGFEYDVDWLESADARPLSLSLPLVSPPDAHLGEHVRNYFDNLLPDDPSMRERMRRRFDARSTSTFDLLAETGGDCVGAIQLLAPGAPVSPLGPAAGNRLSESGVATVLEAARLGGLPGQLEADGFRISLAGAQEKTALLRLDDDWYEPLGTTPTTHILKLPLGRVGMEGVDLSASVGNEWLCTRLVGAIGLPVAEVEMMRFEDRLALVVKRFDRRFSSDGTTLLRLPQEDTCQALGLPSSMKYEADGGPGIEALMRLWSGSRRPADDRHRFFKTQLVFWLLAAPDGHAKNFSLFLERGGRYAMTPLYDIMSVWPYIAPAGLQRRKVKLAMAWRGKNRHFRLAEVRPAHLRATAERVDFGHRFDAVVAELVRDVPSAIATVRAGLEPDFPEHISEPVFEGVERQLRHLAEEA